MVEQQLELLERVRGIERLLVEQTEVILERLARLEEAGRLSLQKEAYTAEEAAKRLGRRPWTVRQWCNKGQVRAKKVPGQGRTGEWRLPHDELLRVEREGPSREGSFENGKGRRAA
jgi:hypothetical protein